MKSYQLYFLALLSGLLLSFAWFPHGFTFLIFIAFVPLLVIEQKIAINYLKYKTLTLFVCAYTTFLIWNVLVTWWVKNASFGGAAMAILANSLLMTFVFLLFHQSKKNIGEKYGAIIFIFYWIAWEYFHLHWDLSWPWLTLGNVFAETPNIIQWYEFTGVFGGSLWVLVINCLIYKLFFSPIEEGVMLSKQKKIGIVLSILILPIIVSLLIFSLFGVNKTMLPSEYEAVVVQPNLDPYHEKFNGNYSQQVADMLKLAEQKVNANTEYLIFPETALAENIWENNIEESDNIKMIRAFQKKYPKLKIVIGASTAKAYESGEELSETARRFSNSEEYYDAYNTALQIDSTNIIQVYHKSKLVPGVEKMPFPFIFKYLENFAIDLGGTSGSLGTQKERIAFKNNSNNISTAPVICYESIYGEYVSDYIKDGAQFISIITNDGWWGDTPGYKQHLKYGALRAIESRMWIARSANTGISCFINPVGEIINETEWWKPAVISQNIQLNRTQTFYVKFGDYIAKIAMCIAILLLIYSWLFRFKILKK